MSFFLYQVYQTRLRERLLNLEALPSDSACVLEAETVKLYVKRHKLGVLFTSLPIGSLFKLAIMT